ncbi:hypothetical protein MMC26_002511 [Xylographa opegraphella]|nr:hypothetical protein [Xylographa opegraphella]
MFTQSSPIDPKATLETHSMTSQLEYPLSTLTINLSSPPPTEFQRHRSRTLNSSLSGLEVLLINMPPDLTDTIFRTLNFSDVLSLRRVNRELANSYAINSILQQPFRGQRLGGCCQAEIAKGWSKVGESEGRNPDYSVYVLEGAPEGWRMLCGSGPHNGHITRYCESHAANVGQCGADGLLEQRARLYEVCSEHRGADSATSSSRSNKLLGSNWKNICEWVPVCESCTVRHMTESPMGSNSCVCQAVIAAEEALLAQEWNCDTCVHRLADSYARTALEGFLRILLGRVMPGATIDEMQAALIGKSSFESLERRTERWREKFGIGEWFTCPMCSEVRAGNLSTSGREKPLVELCLVCRGVFYALEGSKEMIERLEWKFNLISPR